MSIERTALYRWLLAESAEYAGKVLELRREVEGWLAYVPATFPHYTRHTVRHSDEIIAQVSRMLFREEPSSAPVLGSLSPTEAYIVIAGAYLHDAGMVASDAEKSQLVGSEGFQRWILANSQRRERWDAISELRAGSSPTDVAQRHFLADLQVRFIVAEFLRGHHHLRAGTLIRQHEASFGRFAFGDLQLQRVIADVCVAHGLSHHELEDRERFPESRDLRGDKVNVRFCAILLRLGDLLDLSSDRACPMLLNAACPIPPESYPHWTQYRCIERDVAPDRIEIVARCQNAAEHRVLQDWCSWIVDETNSAVALMARARRHQGWRPPFASFGPEHPTIRVERADGAKYVPVDWKFSLDEEQVFGRLVEDVYDRPLAFVRELVQNALDAMRCQLYEDLSRDGLETPRLPTMAAESVRALYTLQVKLSLRDVPNLINGGVDRRQVLTVDDCGIGMDRETIRRHLLQVGRSYYRTEDFRRRYSFVPTGRFGIGFLSVFAQSNDVLVDTWRSSDSNAPIRLSLTGPRNYLLVEESERRQRGTRVEVVLRDSLEPGTLTNFLVELCKRVEFPIHVDDLGQEATIESEKCTQFESSTSDPNQESAERYFVRAYPFSAPGSEGELYVFGSSNAGVENWGWTERDIERLRERNPLYVYPSLPNGLTMFHGLFIGHRPSGRGRLDRVRVDRRGEFERPTLARTSLVVQRRQPFEADLGTEAWELLLREHLQQRILAGSDNSPAYLKRLWNLYPLAFWCEYPDVVEARRCDERVTMSFCQLLAEARIVLLARRQYYLADDWKVPCVVPSHYNGELVVSGAELRFLPDDTLSELIVRRQISKVELLESGWMALVLEGARDPNQPKLTSEICQLVDIGASEIIGLSASVGHAFQQLLLLNRNNALASWLWERSLNPTAKNRWPLKKLAELVSSAARIRLHDHELGTFIKQWVEGAPDDDSFKPPDVAVTRAAFGWDSPVPRWSRRSTS